MNDRFSMYNLTATFDRTRNEDQQPEPNLAEDQRYESDLAEDKPYESELADQQPEPGRAEDQRDESELAEDRGSPMEAATLPAYTGPAVSSGLRAVARIVDPRLAATSLPPYQPSAKGLGENYGNNPDVSAALSSDNYANAPVDPSVAELAETAPQWGNGVVRDNTARGNLLGQQRLAPRALQLAAPNAPSVQPGAPRIPRPLPPIPHRADRVIVEKQNAANPSGPLERRSTQLPQQAQFVGRLVAETGGRIMMLRSTASDADQRSETLIHLPPDASQQLRADKATDTMLDNAIRNGIDAEPLQIAYDRGRWSVAQAPNGQNRARD